MINVEKYHIPKWKLTKAFVNYIFDFKPDPAAIVLPACTVG